MCDSRKFLSIISHRQSTMTSISGGLKDPSPNALRSPLFHVKLGKLRPCRTPTHGFPIRPRICLKIRPGVPRSGSYMSSPALRDETHGNGPSKNLSALEGPNGSTPAGSAGSMGERSVGGGHKKRALAHGYPILPNLNPFGVPTPTGTKGKQEHEVPAFEADQLIKPPACGRCITSNHSMTYENMVNNTSVRIVPRWPKDRLKPHRRTP